MDAAQPHRHLTPNAAPERHTKELRAMTALTVIIASTRPGRAGLPIAQWFVERARAHGDFEVTVVDLAELDLPFLDEPHHPKLRQYTKQHTKDWSALVDASDAFVLVTAEYNHGYPAPLKNALDYLVHEWKDKPVGFVSYGGIAGGTRSLQQLKQVVTALRMTPLVDAVNVPFHVQYFDESGAFRASEATEQAAQALLAELARVEAALRPLRAPASA